MRQQVPMVFLLLLVYLGAVAYISVQISFVSFSRLINFVRQRRKTAKNVGSGTPTIAPIKQTEKTLGPVDSVFLIIF